MCDTGFSHLFSLVNTYLKLSKNSLFCFPPHSPFCVFERILMPGPSAIWFVGWRDSCHTVGINPPLNPVSRILEKHLSSVMLWNSLRCQTAVMTFPGVGQSRWCLFHILLARSHLSRKCGISLGQPPGVERQWVSPPYPGLKSKDVGPQRPYITTTIPTTKWRLMWDGRPSLPAVPAFYTRKAARIVSGEAALPVGTALITTWALLFQHSFLD